MRTLRLVLATHLSRSISSLRDLDPEQDVVLLPEVESEATYVPHHKQKLALTFSAMRHFADGLRDEGVRVRFVRLDSRTNTGTLEGELERELRRRRADRIVVTEPDRWALRDAMDQWEREVGVPVEVREDDRFLCSHERFRRWADGRKTLRMEHFYHEMRRATGWLMDDDRPVGGRWNYDADNRRTLPSNARVPHRRRFRPDATSRDVIDLVSRRFAHHFGDLEPFEWAVTATEAAKALRHFVADCLSRFGDYQDAMLAGDDLLFHSLLSPYLNIGLLEPRAVCEAALRAYDRGTVPLNAVEGFVRQVLGWREFVRGIYWLRMPGYARTNALRGRRRLPAFYWTGRTDMACLRSCIEATRRRAYAHHIQRLMVTGNFALLAGLTPSLVEEWYLVVYADAYEWVELPNTHGMVLFADGGELGSKPYAASGSYIDRMSDYCSTCAYDPNTKLGDGACPFNVLYWHFLIRNEDTLRPNPRMAMVYATLDRMSRERRRAIGRQAMSFLEGLTPADEDTYSAPSA